MAIKKDRKVSFDAMVKFFMHQYSIPTKKDVSELVKRLESMETTIKGVLESGAEKQPESKKAKRTRTSRTGSQSASNAVLEVIRGSHSGLGFSEVRDKTGFDEKKLRNIIFRLNATGRIVRKSRGLYVIAKN
jgi:hypothetical protein